MLGGGGGGASVASELAAKLNRRKETESEVSSSKEEPHKPRATTVASAQPSGGQLAVSGELAALLSKRKEAKEQSAEEQKKGEEAVESGKPRHGGAGGQLAVSGELAALLQKRKKADGEHIVAAPSMLLAPTLAETKGSGYDASSESLLPGAPHPQKNAEEEESEKEEGSVISLSGLSDVAKEDYVGSPLVEKVGVQDNNLSGYESGGETPAGESLADMSLLSMADLAPVKEATPGDSVDICADLSAPTAAGLAQSSTNDLLGGDLFNISAGDGVEQPPSPLPSGEGAPPPFAEFGGVPLDTTPLASSDADGSLL